MQDDYSEFFIFFFSKVLNFNKERINDFLKLLKIKFLNPIQILELFQLESEEDKNMMQSFVNLIAGEQSNQI
jgi:hypothetical protein